MASCLQRRKINRKASFVDVIYIILALLIISVMLLYGSLMNNELADQVLSSELGNSSNIDKAVTSVKNSVNWSYDFIFIASMVGMILFVLFVSYSLDIHPVFAVIFIILILGVGIPLSMMTSNVYNDIYTDTSFDPVRDYFPMQNYIMTHLPMVAAIIFIMVGAALYAKFRNRSNTL